MWVCMGNVQLEKQCVSESLRPRKNRNTTRWTYCRSNQSWNGLDLKQNQMTRISLHWLRYDLQLSACVCVCVYVSLYVCISVIKRCNAKVQEMLFSDWHLSFKTNTTHVTLHVQEYYCVCSYMHVNSCCQQPEAVSKAKILGNEIPPSLQDRNICGEYLSMKCLREVESRPITVAKSTIQGKPSQESTSPEMLSDLSVERSTQTEECIEKAGNRSNWQCVLLCECAWWSCEGACLWNFMWNCITTITILLEWQLYCWPFGCWTKQLPDIHRKTTGAGLVQHTPCQDHHTHFVCT